jgi:murein DD-endopeptidase MepM/ murein hydrolase activator NlpD
VNDEIFRQNGVSVAMRPTILKLCSGNVSRAALLVAAAAVLGGCSSDVGRFSDPIYTGSTPNQRAIMGGDGTYGGNAYAPQHPYVAVPERQWQNVDTTGSIEPGSAGIARTELAPPPVAAEPVAHPLAEATRPVEPAGGYTQVAAAGGWSPAGGTYVTLRQGETLDTLSNRYGVPVAALRQTNNWAAGRAPTAGERVLIPVYSRPTAAAAPAATPAPAPVAAAPAVRQVPTTRVAAAPTPTPPQTLQPPQRLTTGAIPTAAARPASAVAAPVAPVAQRPVPEPQPSGVRLVGAYTVKKGDTLASIAHTYGVSEQALRDRNNLRSAAIAPGQQLFLPAGTKLMLKTSQAPQATTAPTPSAPAAKPAAVAETKPVAKPTTVAEAKPAAKPAAVAEAKPAVPAKPAATAEAKAAAKPTTVAEAKPAAPAKSQQTAAAKAAPAPATPKDTSKIDQHAAETIAVARETAAADDDKGASGSFRWPVRGRIISEYGARANGEKNEGINLAVPEGTSVKAADGGEVIYSGNELKGYGNLVLVRHPNGYVSAYAHASELLVNRGDKVTRGQIIARAGATGSVSQPQLHFELRKGQKAVDPKPYLASN